MEVASSTSRRFAESLLARDMIERAKRILMEREGLSEREAFLTIRRNKPVSPSVHGKKQLRIC